MAICTASDVDWGDVVAEGEEHPDPEYMASNWGEPVWVLQEQDGWKAWKKGTGYRDSKDEEFGEWEWRTDPSNPDEDVASEGNILVDTEEEALKEAAKALLAAMEAAGDDDEYSSRVLKGNNYGEYEYFDVDGLKKIIGELEVGLSRSPQVGGIYQRLSDEGGFEAGELWEVVAIEGGQYTMRRSIDGVEKNSPDTDFVYRGMLSDWKYVGPASEVEETPEPVVVVEEEAPALADRDVLIAEAARIDAMHHVQSGGLLSPGERVVDSLNPALTQEEERLYTKTLRTRSHPNPDESSTHATRT